MIQADDTYPFNYGKPAEGDFFTDRDEDIQRLWMNIQSNINTILISPRRWGKTSLVNSLGRKFAGEKKVKFCYLDLFRVRTEIEFYEALANSTSKSLYSKVEEFTKNVLDNISKIKPNVSIKTDDSAEISLSFDLGAKPAEYKDVIDFPEKMAVKKGIKLVVCIDEFQNIELFEDALSFQKLLRSKWQYHKNVVYLLYGSKRHMLINLFGNQSMPFYKFGDVRFLKKIEFDTLKKFVVKRFNDSGKSISNELAGRIVDLAKLNPYYVQQIAYLVWLNTLKQVKEDAVEKALNELLDQNHYLFLKDFEKLSHFQIRFLRALADDVASGYYSAEVLKNYFLSSSANVKKIIDSLIEKEIIEKFENDIEFIDPIFKLWLKYRVFK